MQDIIVEKPYTFIPPHRGTWWPTLIQKLNLYGWYLRKYEGIVEHEIRHIEKLQASYRAGHGIMLAPNHCRYADPLAMGWLAWKVPCHVYAMASWHLFQSGFNAWAIRKMGGFSIFREGVDKTAISTAIEMLVEAKRPLILFPEGAVSRTNDRIHALLDGVAFIARTAAKKRQKQDPAGKVVIHPVAIKYYYLGDIHETLEPVLAEIESRFSWRPRTKADLLKRIFGVGKALLALKELEFFGEVQKESLANRLANLIDRLLEPIEMELLGKVQTGHVVPRIKALRMKILPDMVAGKLSEEERAVRWEQLADMYLSQQVACYPPDYLDANPSIDRLLETVERFEEDLTDKVRVHGDLKVVMEVGDAIEVSPERDRKAKIDPLMTELETRLQSMINELAKDSRRYRQQ